MTGHEWYEPPAGDRSYIAEQLATMALGGGSARIVTGPELPNLPTGSEYAWIKTDGAGTFVDLITGVA